MQGDHFLWPPLPRKCIWLSVGFPWPFMIAANSFIIDHREQEQHDMSTSCSTKCVGNYISLMASFESRNLNKSIELFAINCPLRIFQFPLPFLNICLFFFECREKVWRGHCQSTRVRQITPNAKISTFEVPWQHYQVGCVKKERLDWFSGFVVQRNKWTMTTEAAATPGENWPWLRTLTCPYGWHVHLHSQIAEHFSKEQL